MARARNPQFAWQLLIALMFSVATAAMALLPLTFARLNPGALGEPVHLTPGHWIPAGLLALATGCAIRLATRSARGLPATVFERLLPWLLPVFGLLAMHLLTSMMRLFGN